MVETYQAFDRYTGHRFHDLMVMRIARQMAILCVLTKTAASMLKKENREYFSALSKARKLFIFACAVLPGPMKALYLYRLNRMDKAHGIQ